MKSNFQLKSSLKRAVVAGALVIVPGLAIAGLSVNDQVGKSEGEIRQVLKGQGYKVIEIEREDGEFEAEVSKDGQSFEFEISAETGLVLETEKDDNDEKDD